MTMIKIQKNDRTEDEVNQEISETRKLEYGEFQAYRDGNKISMRYGRNN